MSDKEKLESANAGIWYLLSVLVGLVGVMIGEYWVLPASLVGAVVLHHMFGGNE